MEGFDLNALRAAGNEAKPEPTREEKIASLQEKITHLEEMVFKPTPAEEFLAKLESEQQSIVDEQNANLPVDEQYESVAQYAAELQGDGVNINEVRLTVARAELAALEAGE